MQIPTSKDQGALDWAREEFGGAALGNGLRKERLVVMAGRVAEKPAGKVTEVFSTSAEREGAYRWLENKNFDETDVGAAAHRSCVRRSKGLPFVFVPMDGCAVSVADSTGGKGFAYQRCCGARMKAINAQPGDLSCTAREVSSARS